jgi:hypothetical protein
MKWTFNRKANNKIPRRIMGFRLEGKTVETPNLGGGMVSWKN